ncbi:MAG: SPOR domain-containing protein [Treponema sp.]|jgi:DedD protein|nr:SPOR domain-containing protein [Treponema sp.]
MEKKKLLLVAVSVGVFLVIVIGASILIFTPRNTLPGPAEASIVKPPVPAETPAARALENQAQEPVSVDAADMVKNAEDLQGLQTPPAATAIQENVFYIYGENPNQAVTVERTGDSGAQLVIEVPKPSTAAVPDVPAAPLKPASVVAAVPARRETAPPAAASRTPPAGAAKPAPAPAQTKLYDDYWVQTGSFSTKARADGVKETLASKGIGSVIENREVEGKTFYRVRVGPYTSKNEADYWLSLIRSINGFEDSQVWKSQSRR